MNSITYPNESAFISKTRRIMSLAKIALDNAILGIEIYNESYVNYGNIKINIELFWCEIRRFLRSPFSSKCYECYEKQMVNSYGELWYLSSERPTLRREQPYKKFNFDIECEFCGKIEENSINIEYL
jgi:hypothetical protein